MKGLSRPRLATPFGSSTSIYILMDVLGVPLVGPFARRRNNEPRQRRRQDYFWLRNGPHLESMLFDVHSAYKKAIRRAHPDRGGSHEGCVRVNAAWAKVKKLFGKHGVTL